MACILRKKSRSDPQIPSSERILRRRTKRQTAPRSPVTVLDAGKRPFVRSSVKKPVPQYRTKQSLNTGQSRAKAETLSYEGTFWCTKGGVGDVVAIPHPALTERDISRAGGRCPP